MHSIRIATPSRSVKCSASMAPAYMRGVPRATYQKRYQQVTTNFTWALPELPTLPAAA